MHCCREQASAAPSTSLERMITSARCILSCRDAWWCGNRGVAIDAWEVMASAPTGEYSHSARSDQRQRAGGLRSTAPRPSCGLATSSEFRICSETFTKSGINPSEAGSCMYSRRESSQTRRSDTHPNHRNGESYEALPQCRCIDPFREPAQAPSAERAVFTAVAERTITVNDNTKWVNVNHYEVVRFASNGQEFTWYFDGLAQPRPFDLAQIAPAGFVNHNVTVYVAPTERDFPG